MAVGDQAFPRLDTQAIDPKTGRITQPWYRFFISLWVRSGSGTGYDIGEISREATEALLDSVMSDLDFDPVTKGELLGFSEERIETPAPIPMVSAGSEELSDSPVPAVQAVAASGSPVVFVARASGFLLISGGTVSAVSMTRAGSVTAFPAATAILPLSPGDAASVTYTAAPTLTFIPR